MPAMPTAPIIPVVTRLPSPDEKTGETPNAEPHEVALLVIAGEVVPVIISTRFVMGVVGAVNSVGAVAFTRGDAFAVLSY